MSELPPPSEHPLAAVHPRAFRACRACARWRARCAWSVLIGLALLLATPAVAAVLSLASSLRWLEYCVGGAVAVLGFLWLGALAGLIALSLLRWGIIALFFARYSLAQLLGCTLFIGACGTGLATLPGIWKLFPAVGLCTLVTVVFVYIGDQDPEGPVQTPEFLRRALDRRRTTEPAEPAPPGEPS